MEEVKIVLALNNRQQSLSKLVSWNNS